MAGSRRGDEREQDRIRGVEKKRRRRRRGGVGRKQRWGSGSKRHKDDGENQIRDVRLEGR